MTELLTAQEVAALLKVPLRTIYEWARTGQIPHLRCNRLLRFDQGEIYKAFSVPAAGPDPWGDRS
ncbi:MAG: helix-turn-helix domain-containing protein [Candidatus Geothermincolia bacterium]